MTRWHKLSPILLLAAVACGGGGNSSTDAPSTGHDGSLDGAPGTTAVAVTTATSPTLYEYKDGSGAWTPIPAPDGNGQSTIHVTDDFLLLAVCAGSGADFAANMVGATASDGDQEINCFLASDGSGSGAPPATVTVSGTMAQAGSIQFGTDGVEASGNTAPWAWTLLGEPVSSNYDVIGIDKAGAKMVIRRAIAVATTPVTVTPALDVTAADTTTAGPLQKPAIAVTGLATGATVTSDTDLATDNGFFDLGGTATTGVLAPDSILTADDEEVTSVDATTASGRQDAFLFGGTGFALPATFALIPQPTGVTFTEASTTVAASWTTPPTTTGTTSIVVRGAGNQSQQMMATPAWITATGATKLQLDTTATGYLPAWDIDLSAYTADVEVDTFDTATNVGYTGVTHDPGQKTPAVRAPQPPHRLRAIHAGRALRHRR